MKRNLTILGLFALMTVFCFADAPDGYYDSVEGLSGEALKAGLNNIIDNHTEFSYDDVYDILMITDRDPSNPNNVILIHTGWSADASEQYPLWNREHIWAKSHGDFGTSMGAGSDLHHLRPSDCSVNSARGNKDFDNGGDEYIDGSGEMQGATGCYSDSDSWETRDGAKGDVARMIFYMATRYEGENGELDLEVNEQVDNSPQPFHGKLSTLLQWHEQDPPDEFEMTRNDIIYDDYQHNRNPFIDRPEFVDEIWGNGGGTETISIYDIQYTNDTGNDDTYPSLYNGQTITTEGIVTAVGNGDNSDSFYLQMQAGAEWSGIYVYESGNTSLNIGDKIEITAKVEEYYGLTELKDISNIEVISSNNDLPEVVSLTTNEVGNGEAYEGVLVRVNNVEVAIEPDPTYGELYVNDGSGQCQIDDFFVEWENLQDPFVVGETWIYIQGVVDYGYNNYAINPRMISDLNYDEVAANDMNSALFKSKVYPNPYIINGNRENFLTINFYLEENSDVKLNIFNLKGQLVKSLANENLNQGENNVKWMGKDNSGNPVKSGMYFYKLSNGRGTSNKKFLLIK